MKNKRRILSAGAVTAFSISLAVGLMATVDQTSMQQGAPLQGVHPPTTYGTPSERAAGHQQPGAPQSQLREASTQNQLQHHQATRQQRQIESQEFGARQETTGAQTDPRLTQDQAGQQQWGAGQQQAGQQQVGQQQDRQQMGVGQQDRQMDLASNGESHKASDLMEKRVENRDGERLGSVEDLIIDVESGEVQFVVVSSGGILGLGGDLRAVPPAALQVSDEERIVLDISQDRWEQAPTFEREQVAQLGQQQQQIESFYGHGGAQIDGQQQFGARDGQANQTGGAQWGAQQQDRQESQQQWGGQNQRETQQWGTQQQERNGTRAMGQQQMDGPDRPGSPSQVWQQRHHQTAEPHRLPGDPHHAPAQPRTMTPDRTGVEPGFQEESHLRQQQQQQRQQGEFGARNQPQAQEYDWQAQQGQYDSRATEWRARAFEEEIQQAEQNRAPREFGARQQHGAQQTDARQWGMDRQTTDRQWGVDERELRGAPALNNPRLHHSHRGTLRTGQEPVFGQRGVERQQVQRQQTTQERIYGQPDYRQGGAGSQEQFQQEFGATQRDHQQTSVQHQQRAQQHTGGQQMTQQHQAGVHTQQQGRQQLDQQRQGQQQLGQQGQGNLKMATDLLGRNVTDQQQQQIGEITDLIVDLQTGRIEHAIVRGEGGQQQRYAIPVGQLQVDQQDRVTLQASRQQLDQAPRYEQRTARQQRDQIFRYDEQRGREFGGAERDEDRRDREDREDALRQNEARQQDEARLDQDDATARADEDRQAETTEFGAREQRTAAQTGEAGTEADTAEAAAATGQDTQGVDTRTQEREGVWGQEGPRGQERGQEGTARGQGIN